MSVVDVFVSGLGRAAQVSRIASSSTSIGWPSSSTTRRLPRSLSGIPSRAAPKSRT